MKDLSSGVATSHMLERCAQAERKLTSKNEAPYFYNNFDFNDLRGATTKFGLPNQN